MVPFSVQTTNVHVHNYIFNLQYRISHTSDLVVPVSLNSIVKNNDNPSLPLRIILVSTKNIS